MARKFKNLNVRAKSLNLAIFSVKIQISDFYLTLLLRITRGKPRKLFLCLLEALILVISAPEPTRPKLPCFGDLYPPKHVFQYHVTHYL